VGLTLEQRLAGLTLEQILEAMWHLTAEQVLLGLPETTLRSLPDEFLAALSEPTRAAIRSRIGH
jgi:hypothetical protein